MPFDELFIEVDILLNENYFDDEVICQTGQSKYIPKNCENFNFMPNVDRYFEEADFIIVHGGTGSTLGALQSGKPFIALANPRAEADHQAEFLQELSKEYNIYWSRECSDIKSMYRKAISNNNKGTGFSKSCTLGDWILENI